MTNEQRAARYMLAKMLELAAGAANSDLLPVAELIIEGHNNGSDPTIDNLGCETYVLYSDEVLDHVRELARSLSVDIGFQAEQGITYPFELSDCTHEKFCRVCRRRHYASCEESKKLRAEHNMR